MKKIANEKFIDLEVQMQKMFKENKTNSIYYPAKEKNDPLNLLDFSKIIQLHFEGTYISPFDSWEAAFDYISKRVIDRTAIIIDEFPYIAEENESV